MQLKKSVGHYILKTFYNNDKNDATEARNGNNLERIIQKILQKSENLGKDDHFNSESDLKCKIKIIPIPVNCKSKMVPIPRIG